MSASAFVAPAAWGQGCPGDLNGDRTVNGADLGALLGNWGHPGTGDIDGNGTVDGADLGALLGGWGACPPVVPAWATLLEAQPDPAVVTDPALRAAIAATGLAWRVRDTGTQTEMMLIPPGTFQMGCIMGSNHYGCWPDQLPVHQVTLTSGFYIGRFEVTQAQWSSTMGSNPSNFQGYADSATRPVEMVTWTAIQGYLAATGTRLPTEAEWEYACRAGTPTPFYNGSTLDSSVWDLAWYSWTALNQTHAVGGKAPNGFGLHDMLGNVWEWVNDWQEYYPSAPQTDPTGPASGTVRVVRGGAWFDNTDAVRASARDWWSPSAKGSGIGFRVARNP